MGKLTATTHPDKDPVFETEDFPVQDPTWVLAFDESGGAVSMFKEPRTFDWALRALHNIEEVLMRQAGYFDNLDLDGPSDD